MKNRFSKILTVLISLIFMVSIVGCQSKNVKNKESNKNKKKDIVRNITVWICNNDKNIIRDQIGIFNKKYPNINVNVVAMEPKDIIVNYINDCSDNKGLPDAIEVLDTNASMLINGFSDKFANVSQDSDIKKGMFLNNRINNLSRKGKVYGYPWYTQPVFMLYRSDILKNLGMDSSDIRTWQDYVSLQNQIKPQGKNLMTISSISQLYDIQLNELGTDFFDDNGKLDIKNDTIMEANEFMYDTLKKNVDIDINANTDKFAAFNNGSSISIMATISDVLYMEKTYPNLKGNVALERLPAFEDGGNNTAYINGTNFMISDSSKNKEYATQFVKFITGDKNSVYNQFSVYGLCSSNASAYNYDKMHKQNSYIKNNNDIYKLYINSAKFFSDFSYNQNYAEIRDYIINNTNANISKNKDIDETINDSQKYLEQRYK